MNEVSLIEYIQNCDAMNLRNIMETKEDLTGRYVKLHIQVIDHKKFKSEEGKMKRTSQWTQASNIQDDVWYCKVYSEQIDDYVYPKASFETLYFLNQEEINAATLSKDDKLIVYGQIIEHNIENAEFEMIVRYYDKE